ncbi:FAD-dependent oxidoreductase [Novosphingobium sp.]|uniref:FAD-dependent oxidoreductase n=1 Tax=Novosphingobium sp. TaxID=1874826 RepID=UPI0025FB7D60|nr:FAD-dependent oxidoreductase [Novosphingobium sp.]
MTGPAKRVVVLGSGGAGLTAAIAAHDAGAQVSVYEKHGQIGGTTAWSGGMVWIPGNPHEAGLDVEDSREKALTYLMGLSHDMIPRDMAEAFLDAGPAMIRHLEANGPVQFRPIPDFPDYHAEHPGGMPRGGRSLDCPLYPFEELGEWRDRVTRSPYYPDPRYSIFDTPLGQARPEPVAEAELERRAQQDERGSGQALIGRLLRACLDRGIEPVTSARALRLVTEDGAVRGVMVEIGGHESSIAADAVILATGGFEWDDELKRAFLRGPMTHPVSIQTNTGDGLRMAMRIGAQLGNMREAWWMPVHEVPREDVSTGVVLVAGSRALPRSIMINRKGRRFVNEAANYNAFGAAFHEHDVSAFDYANLPCWLVFDQGYIDQYGFGMMGGVPGEPPPQWVMRADGLAELAQRLGLPRGALEQTVERWNGMVAGGRDEDFARGEAAHDIWWGDPDHRGSVSATLGPLEHGPYYAIEIKSGALGTKGGPKTDRNARVLNVDGAPIDGLYAAGNVMASAMGMTYGGPGGTIAPGMVFGFVAGRHAAGDPFFVEAAA